MKIICLFFSLLLVLTGCGKGNHHLPTPSHGESPLVGLDIYAINDLHGKLTDTDAQPGVDELSGYLRQAQQNGNTLLLATGDMWQGAAESNLTGGRIVTEWMNELGFAAMTMGGHEYDWGEEQIRQNRELAKFPFLAINIYDRQTDQPVEYCQSSVVIDVDGVQVGIIGAIGNCYYSIATEHTRDVYFKVGEELTALVKAEADKLRNEGVECIVYALHDGHDETSNGVSALEVDEEDLSSYYDTALSDGYVDVVFEADSHYTYTLIDRHGVYHLQAGGNNNGISHAGVVIDRTNGEVTVHTAEFLPASKYRHLEEDPVVEDLLKKYEADISPATRIVGTNSRYRSGVDLCQAVADLYCAKGVEKWGDEYDIVLGGGYISCRSPGYLSVGEVSYSQLMALLPFDNPITLCSIRGSDLVSRFLESDHDAYYICTSAYGDSVRDHIDPNATYYVVTDTYSANYSYNHMTIVDTYDPNIFARDLMADAIAAGDW